MIRRGLAGDQIITIKLPQSFLHLKLEDRAGQVSADGKTFFPNLTALVEFYKTNPISSTLNLRLR